MSFNDNASLDTSRMGGGGGGGGRGPVVAGGGLLGLIVLVLSLFFGGGLPGGDDPSAPGQGGQAQGGNDFEHCRTGADANKYDDCRMVGGENSLNGYWKSQPDLARDLEQAGAQFRGPAKTVIYSGVTQSRCGTASNQVGPFYCPLDKQVYIDADFFDLLSSQFGADGGNFAHMYVVAHEYGHALQDQLDLLDRAQQDPKGPESGGVRIELMADCFSGMWAKDAA